MSTPGIWWARDPGDGRIHAVATVDIEAAPGRGWTEALCELRLPVDVALYSGREDAELCWPCHVGAVADLRDPSAP